MNTTTSTSVAATFVLPKGAVTGYVASELHLIVACAGVSTVVTSGIVVTDSTVDDDGSVVVTVPLLEGYNNVTLYRTTTAGGAGVADMDTDAAIQVKLGSGTITKATSVSTMTLS